MTEAPKIIVLTGSGISQESGLPTFRDPDGLWSARRLQELASPRAFARDPAAVHEFYNARRTQANSEAVRPNAAHHALARLEQAMAGDVLLVTQNVDGLHEAAGSRNVLHMHGQLNRVRCTGCAVRHDWTGDLSVTTPCPACGATRLRPDIVWFGEMPFHMAEIEAALPRCDLFVSIGASGSVYPAADFVERVGPRARTVELNLEPSQRASLFAERRYGRASVIVPAFVEELLAPRSPAAWSIGSATSCAASRGSSAGSRDQALDRAVGCLLGQVIGDNLGALVEFCSAAEIRATYPEGVRNLHDGGTWNILAGQPTDDSELALALARSLVAERTYDAEAAASAYARWYLSAPFDMGNTIRRAFRAAAGVTAGRAAAAIAAADHAVPSNGSLMRVSPIGIAAATPAQAAEWAATDSRLSHPHAECVAACAAYAAAIRVGIAGAMPAEMHAVALGTATAMGADGVIAALRAAAAGELPGDYQTQMGWVLIALQNAFQALLHAPDPDRAVIETVGRGGDTDTNAAIAGALLGAAHGRAAWPARWTAPVLACRPSRGSASGQPRPEEYWPMDVPELAEDLLTVTLFTDRAAL